MNKLFTKKQIMYGSFVFGPISAIYFLKVNFEGLSEPENSRKTIVYGSIFTLASVLILLLTPDTGEINIVFPLLCSGVAYHIAKRHQYEKLKNTAASDFYYYSNWNVVWIGLLFLLLFLLVTLLCAFALSYAGAIDV